MAMFTILGIVIFFVSLPLMLWYVNKYHNLDNPEIFLISCSAACLGFAWPVIIAMAIMFGFTYTLAYIIKRVS